MTETQIDRRRTRQSAQPHEDTSRLRRLIAEKLSVLTRKIDEDGHYPEDFLRAYGRDYGFGHAVDPRYGGQPGGLVGVITGMEACSEQCVSTGFLVWCQTSCAWYLQKSANAALKQSLLPAICSGEQLAGTGLSNLLKARSQIEPLRLRATQAPGGYRILGTLPWVSNLAPG
ncbi:MAG: acyl-CoA dehydrogenase family protein, partial [Acidiferrobacter sp.]